MEDHIASRTELQPSTRGVGAFRNLARASSDHLRIPCCTPNDLPHWWYQEVMSVARRASLQAGASPEDAEEVASSTAQVVSNRLASGADIVQVASYTIRVATNQTVDKLGKAKKRLRSWQDPDDKIEGVPDSSPSPFQVVKGKVFKDVVLNALFCLSSRNQAEAMRLHLVEELTVIEIASRLDASPNTVKTWIRRGIRSLRKNKDLLNALDFVE